MKTFLKLLLLAGILAGAYLYFVPGASVSDFTRFLPKPARIDPATGKPLIACARCEGAGLVTCKGAGCVEGKVECNGPCLRLTKGRWVKDEKLGKGPDVRWMVFRQGNSYQAWTESHVGEVIEMQNGKAVNIGACKICNGTTRMPCKVCGATAQVTCPVCQGRKEVPDMKAGGTPPPVVSAATASPPPASAPSPAAEMRAITLKSGETIQGRIVIRDETTVVIRTADGQSRQVPRGDLAE